MAIVKNVSSEIGDIIRVEASNVIVGIVGITLFIDNIGDETASNYFSKTFRYSIDGGINFTEWINLTTENIQSISVVKQSQFIIEYKYLHDGIEPSTLLTFEDLTLTGSYEELNYPVYKRNIFNTFFDVNDVDVLSWSLNVLEKLYDKGIIPEYITRKDEELNPITSDADFLALFNTTTHFFAIIVNYARQFKDIENNETLLPLFIESLGLYTGINITTKHLQYLFKNYKDEFVKRGTSLIAEINNDDDIPNGELARLVSYTDPEEFLFALLEPHTMGWCLGKSSPTFNYTRHCVNMIKGYETNGVIEDISKYPKTGSADLIISDNQLLITSTTTPISSPRGIYNGGSFDADKAIAVDSSLDYEIILSLETNNTQSVLYMGIYFFDENETLIDGYNLKDKTSTPYMFSLKTLPRVDKQYQIRGIVFNKDTDSYIGDTEDMGLDIGFGGHLKFVGDVKYMMPFFYTQDPTLTETPRVTFDKFEVRPLNFNFTLGKLGIKNILYLLYKNNSLYVDSNIYSKIKNKLIPYNAELIDNSIE